MTKEFNLSSKKGIKIQTEYGEVEIEDAFHGQHVREFIKKLKEFVNPQGAKKYYENIIYTPKDIIERINTLAGSELSK